MTPNNPPGPEGAAPSSSGFPGEGARLTLPSRKSVSGRVVVTLASVARSAPAAASVPDSTAAETPPTTGFAPLPSAAPSTRGVAILPAKEAPAALQKRLSSSSSGTLPQVNRTTTQVKLPPKSAALPKLASLGATPADATPAAASPLSADKDVPFTPPPLPEKKVPPAAQTKSRPRLPSFRFKRFSAAAAEPELAPPPLQAPAPIPAGLQSLEDYTGRHESKTEAAPPFPPAAPVAPAPVAETKAAEFPPLTHPKKAMAVPPPLPTEKLPVLNRPPVEAVPPPVSVAPPLVDNALHPPGEKHRLPPPLHENRQEDAFPPLVKAPSRAEPAQGAIAVGAPLSQGSPVPPRPAALPPPLPLTPPKEATPPAPAVDSPFPHEPAVAKAPLPLQPAFPADPEEKLAATPALPPPLPPPQPPPAHDTPPPAPVTPPPLKQSFLPLPKKLDEPTPAIATSPAILAAAALAPELAAAIPSGTAVPEMSAPNPSETAVPSLRADAVPAPPLPPKLPESAKISGKLLPTETSFPWQPKKIVPPSLTTSGRPAFASTTIPERARAISAAKESPPPISDAVPEPAASGPPPHGETALLSATLPPTAPKTAIAPEPAPVAAPPGMPSEPPIPVVPVPAGKTPAARSARARKRRLAGTIAFYFLFIAVVLPLIYFLGLHFGSETRLEGQVIPPPGTTLNTEVWIVNDFRDLAAGVAEDLAAERAPKLQEIQERQDHVQRAQADIAAREERIRLLQEQLQADKDEIDSVIKQAQADAQKIWDGPGAQVEVQYNQRLDELQAAIAARAKSLNLTYQPDPAYRSPEVWANAYRLALYQTPPGVDNAKEHQWIEDQLKQWRDFTKTLDDRQQQLRQQAADVQLSPKPRIAALNDQITDLQHRIDSTVSEEDPLKLELQQAQSDLVQSQAAEAALDPKYYQQLDALPEQSITRRLPLLPDGRFSWRQMEKDFSGDEQVHSYWLFARAIRGDGRQFWALVRFSIHRNNTLPMVIEPDSFVSTKAILRPDLPADDTPP